MLTLHHITHAVSVVIICFLIKKYIELKVQHSDLKFQYETLKMLCGNNQHEKPSWTCSGSGQSNFAFAQSKTGSNPHELKTVASISHQASTAENHMFAEQLRPSEVQVEDYGRTSGYAVEEHDSPSKVDGITDAIPGYSAQTQLPPLDQALRGHQAQVQPSFTFGSAVPMATKGLEVLNARHSVDGKTEVTENGHMTTASLDRTSESLGQVNLSPSSTSQDGPGSEPQGKPATGHSSLSSAESDFYLGSQADDATVRNEQYILATGSYSDVDSGSEDSLQVGMQRTPFIPTNVETSFSEEEWEKYEEEDENDARPSLARLPQQQLSNNELKKMAERGSSAQCIGTTISDRTCRFQNLCFDIKSGRFVVFHSKNGVFINMPSLAKDEALLELSTVAGHNAQYLYVTDMPADHIKHFKVTTVLGTTVIFKRFKPDNIMHAFHDDIIPLFHTLQSLKLIPTNSDTWDGKYPVSIFLADDNSEGEFWGLYDTFAGNDIFTRESLVTLESDYLCFPDAHVGLTKATTWYQYGFFEPQGPVINSQVTSQDIHNVASYLLNCFARGCPMCGNGGHLVLLLREETRLILNQMELVMAISKEFRLKVMTVSFQTHGLSDMISIIHSSRGIIGMHGSLLSLAMFLKQGSIVVELFPYAVNPDRYTPYKSLCEIPGMNIMYRTWRNHHTNNSVPHPDWSSEFGGIYDLPAEQQREIVTQTEVPVHLCCEDPSWLYHIFQDTIVNIPEVLVLVKSALEEGHSFWTEKKLSENGEKIVPGPV